MTATAMTTTWTIDPAHSSAQFAVRHFMVATVKGSFREMSGSVSLDPVTQQANVEVQIPVVSVDTHNAQRDAHLRTSDFFDAENHPLLVFKSKHVEGDVRGSFKLIGDLTMRGVTREIVLYVNSEGSGQDPYGNERMGFSAKTTVNRQDFGLRWNQALEAGGVTVGDEVKISIDVELVRPLA